GNSRAAEPGLGAGRQRMTARSAYRRQMYQELFGEGPSDPFQISSILHQCTPIGYQTRQFALLLGAVNSFTISSAALSTAPGGPSSCRTTSNPRRISSTRFLSSSDGESSFF